MFHFDPPGNIRKSKVSGRFTRNHWEETSLSKFLGDGKQNHVILLLSILEKLEIKLQNNRSNENIVS